MEIIFTKNSEKLARTISNKMRLSSFQCNTKHFNNGEMKVVLDKTFNDVIVFSCTVTNDDWIELFLLLDTLKDSKNIILCLSYMGYSRQDKQLVNESYGSRLFATILESFNISSCILIDNHSEPLLRVPTIHINSQSIFQKDITNQYKADQCAIVAPDIGGADRAFTLSRSLGFPFVICSKARSVFGDLKEISVMGNVEGKTCIIIDDIIDSGKTLYKAACSLVEAGALETIAYCTHGIFSDGSIELLSKSTIKEIIITDTVQTSSNLPAKFRNLSIDSLIIDAIKCKMSLL